MPSTASPPSRFPLPTSFQHPVFPATLQPIVQTFYVSQMWCWTREMEDVYQTFSGWEQLAETCRAFCGVWELEGSEEEYETARGWVKWVRVNFVDWVGLRRNYISTFLPGGLPHSIGELEALDLRPNLLELVSIPPYVDPLGGRTVTPESLMKAVQRIVQRPDRKSAPTAISFDTLPLPPKGHLPFFDRSSAPSLLRPISGSKDRTPTSVVAAIRTLPAPSAPACDRLPTSTKEEPNMSVTVESESRGLRHRVVGGDWTFTESVSFRRGSRRVSSDVD